MCNNRPVVVQQESHPSTIDALQLARWGLTQRVVLQLPAGPFDGYLPPCVVICKECARKEGRSVWRLLGVSDGKACPAFLDRISLLQ